MAIMVMYSLDDVPAVDGTDFKLSAAPRCYTEMNKASGTYAFPVMSSGKNRIVPLDVTVDRDGVRPSIFWRTTKPKRTRSAHQGNRRRRMMHLLRNRSLHGGSLNQSRRPAAGIQFFHLSNQSTLTDPYGEESSSPSAKEIVKVSWPQQFLFTMYCTFLIFPLAAHQPRSGPVVHFRDWYKFKLHKQLLIAAEGIYTGQFVDCGRCF